MSGPGVANPLAVAAPPDADSVSGPTAIATWLRATGIPGRDVLQFLRLGALFAIIYGFIAFVLHFAVGLGNCVTGDGESQRNAVSEGLQSFLVALGLPLSFCMGFVALHEERPGVLVPRNLLPVGRTSLFFRKLAAGYVVLAALLLVAVAGVALLYADVPGALGDALRKIARSSTPLMLFVGDPLLVFLAGAAAASLFPRAPAVGVAVGFFLLFAYPRGFTVELASHLTPSTERTATLLTGLGHAAVLAGLARIGMSRRLEGEGVALLWRPLGGGLPALPLFGRWSLGWSPVLTFLILMTAIVVLMVWYPLLDPVEAMELFPLVVVAALIGATCIRPEETDGIRFGLYALPLCRARLLAARALIAILFALASLAVGLIAVAWLAPARGLDFVFAHGASLTMVAIGAALVGLLVRLFIRFVLIAMFVAGAAILMPAMAGLLALELIRHDVPLWPHLALAQLLWCVAVLTGLPALFLWVAFCRSPLLELPERTRGPLGILVVGALVILQIGLLRWSPVLTLAAMW